jgi:hypothetical protein
MSGLLLAGSWMLAPGDSSSIDHHVRFQEVAAQIGAANRHVAPTLAEDFDHLMPWMTSVGAAVAAGDFDGDGAVDLYVVNGGRDLPNRLFRNRGDGNFEEVFDTGVSDLNRQGACMDAAFLDYDNDGDQDLYVVKWGAPNRLLENRGDGTFEDVGERAGVDYRGYGNGVLVFDYDRDGHLDLFLANFFPEQVEDPASGRSVPNDLWNPVSTRVLHESFTRAANGGRNVLYRNLGDGTFEDVTEASGIRHTGWSFDAGAGDLNNDGWPDLYIANDFGPDELYFNTGATEAPAAFHLVVDPAGHPGIGNDWWKGMNVEMGDVDGNGRLDIYVTNALVRGYKTDEGNMLWLNYPGADRPGGTRFANLAAGTGSQDGGWGWGAKFADFNNDGRLDIFSVNGFITGSDPDNTYWFQLQEMVTQVNYNSADARDWPELEDRDLSGYEPNRLFLQLPPTDEGSPPRFIETASASGITDLLNGRGVSVLDYDDDGDLDVYVANQAAPSSLYRNESGEQQHWLGLSLEGAPHLPLVTTGPAATTQRRFASSRDAIGARVRLCTADGCQLRELTPSNGFAAQSDPRVHFGLGDTTEVLLLEVRWPSGRVSRLDPGDLALDRYHHLVEGVGLVAPAAASSSLLARGAEPQAPAAPNLGVDGAAVQ